MKKYKIVVWSDSMYPHEFESTSRNAKQHAIDRVGTRAGAAAAVFTLGGVFVSGVVYSYEKCDFYYICK